MMGKLLKKNLIIILAVIAAIAIAALLFLNFYDGVGKAPDKEKQTSYAKRTDLFYDGKFHNQNPVPLITEGSIEKGAEIKPDQEVPVEKRQSIETADPDQLLVTWLGHSSVLLQMKGLNLLIDPVLSEYASPVDFLGPKRFSAAAIAPENLPEIDILFISHDHYDHLDYQTITAIDSKVKNYVVPLGVENYLLDWGIEKSRIHDLAWWEEVGFNGLSITATPAQHYGGRNPLKKDATWWCGYFIQSDQHTVYFTGDTGYSDSFKEIYERLGKVDLMLADSAQYGEAWAAIHMTPQEAYRAATEAGAKWLIPVHWGAFSLAYHDWHEPPRQLTEIKNPAVNIAIPQIGATVDYENLDTIDEKWWEFAE